MEYEFDYVISSSCIVCGKCLSACPEHCIDVLKHPCVIDQEKCVHCGSCAEICPVGAVAKMD